MWLVPLLLPALVPAGPVLPPQATVAPAEVRVERRVACMGTWLGMEVWGRDRRGALDASERAFRALRTVETRLSTWTDGSALARLNAAPVGTEHALEPALEADLLRAREFWRLTDGAFDPGVGPLVEAWGLRTGGRFPSDPELAAALAPGGFRGFELTPGHARRLHPAARLEEGGFGKGAGLEAALAALEEAGVRRARLDLGGQLAFLGDVPEVHGLAHPDERERAVLELELAGGSLATSGNGVRGLVVDGERIGHLLDPRTGRPAPDFGSLTVWAPRAFDADALSTGLWVLGPEAALAFAERHPEVRVVALVRREDGLEALASEGWRGKITPRDPDVRLRFVSSAIRAGEANVKDEER